MSLLGTDPKKSGIPTSASTMGHCKHPAELSGKFSDTLAGLGEMMSKFLK